MTALEFQWYAVRSSKQRPRMARDGVRSHLLPYAVLLAAASACGGDDMDDERDVESASSSEVTYWQDVAPIFNGKCVKCHQEGGAGPFPLDDYETAKQYAELAAFSTREGTMPPFLVSHDGSCGDFYDDDTLTEEEIETIEQWAYGDQAEGTEVELTPPEVPTLDGDTEYTTPTIVPEPSGAPYAEYDEWRCFPFDSDLDEDAYITAYDVRPGNPVFVHHVVAFLVDPERKNAEGQTNAETMQALDDSDPDRPGWPCFGWAGEGVVVDSAPALWAPGMPPVEFPDGSGMLHRQDHEVIVQIHYHLEDSRYHGQMDSTSVVFRHSREVERRTVSILKDGFVDTLMTDEPASLPPGKRAAEYSWTVNLDEMLAPDGLGPIPYMDLLGIVPHMHTRGVRQTLRIGEAGEEKECAAHVERWDFNWQKIYFYRDPPRLTASTELQFSCEYDTTGETAPIHPGWGYTDEMCAAIVVLGLPPGM